MDDKELIARLTEASWSLDYPEDLIAVRAAARLTALAEENERLKAERNKGEWTKEVPDGCATPSRATCGPCGS